MLQVAVIDQKQKNMLNDIQDLQYSSRELSDGLHDVKVQLAHQSTSLEHLSESIKFLTSSVKEGTEKQETILSKINANDVNNASYKTKLKILWSILAIFGTLMSGFLFNLLFK